jgi:hypothetical protein
MSRARWVLAIGALSAGLGLWLVLTPPHEPAARAERVSVVDEAPEMAEQGAPSPARLTPVKAATLPRPAPNALNVVGPGPSDPHEPGMVPHPRDEARARLDAENRLIQALNDAMSFRKVKEMREMLVTYRQLDPQDIDKNQLGYQVVADCIESPGDASLAAARAFYGKQRHSSLRRFVRRICFENKS